MATPQQHNSERITPGKQHGYDRATCKACDATIYWTTKVDVDGQVKRKRDGKAVRDPIDPMPTREGAILLVGNGRSRQIGKSEFIAESERYQSHWVTCPHRDRIRKGGRR